MDFVDDFFEKWRCEWRCKCRHVDVGWRPAAAGGGGGGGGGGSGGGADAGEVGEFVAVVVGILYFHPIWVGGKRVSSGSCTGSGSSGSRCGTRGIDESVVL